MRMLHWLMSAALCGRVLAVVWLGATLSVAAADNSDELPGYVAGVGAVLPDFERRTFFGDAPRVRIVGQTAITLARPSTLVATNLHTNVSKRTFLPLGSYNDFAIAADGQTIWVVGVTSDLLVSRDAGKTWAKVRNAMAPVWHRVEASADGSKVWVSNSKNGVAYSGDGGATWSKVLLPSDMTVFEIRLADEGKTLLVAGDVGRIAIGPAEKGPMVVHKCAVGARGFYTVAQSPDKSEILAAGRDGFACASADGGASWQPLHIKEASTQDIRDAVYDSAARGFLLVGDRGTILQPTGKNRWREMAINWLDEKLGAVAIDPSSQTAIAAGAGGILVVRRGAGREWLAIDDTSKEHGGFITLAVSKSGNVILLGGLNGSVLVSADAGQTFRSEQTGDSSIYAASVSDSGQIRVIGDSGGRIYRWTEATQKWTLDAEVDNLVNDISLSPDGRDLVIATTSAGVWLKEGAAKPKQVYVPTDGNSLTVITRSANGQALAVGGSKGLVLLSSDGGRVWTPKPIKAEPNVTALLVSGHGGVFAGTDTGDIHYLAADSEVWQLTSASRRGKISAMAEVDRNIWFGIGSALFLSRDRLLSSGQPATLEGGISGLAVAGATLWLASSKHELGAIVPSQAHFPELVSYEPIQTLRPKGNILDVTFSRSAQCQTTPLQFSGRLGSTEAAFLPIKVTKSEPISLDRQQIHFDLPMTVPTGPLSLRLFATCEQFIYGYTFHGLRLTPWIEHVPGGWSTVAGVSFLVGIPLLSMLLYVFSPLHLLTLRDVLTGSALPAGVAQIAKLLDAVLLTGVLCKRPRVLDAWVRSRRGEVLKHWRGHPTFKRLGVYMPLPLAVSLDGEAEQLHAEPSGEWLGQVIQASLAGIQTIQILGVGGIGKTTLALAHGEWGAQGLLLGHPAVVVVVSKLESDLQSSLASALQVMLDERSPSKLLLLELIRQRRVFPFFDRVSELSDEARAGVAALCAQAPLAILAAREEQELQGTSLRLLPGFLSSGSTLLRYVEHELVLNSKLAKASPIVVPTAIGAELVKIIYGDRLLHHAASGTEPKITPLLARTFVALAVELLRSERDLGQMPRSVALLYVSYVRLLRRPGDRAFANVQEWDYLSLCGQLAARAMESGFGPASLEREMAQEVIATVVGAHTAGMVLDGLLQIGVLQEARKLGVTRVSFMVDSYAEAMAAWIISRETPLGAALEITLAKRIAGDVSSQSARLVMAFAADLRHHRAQASNESQSGALF